MRNSPGPGLAVLVLLLLQTGGALGFEIFPSEDSLNHPTITERALLNATLQVCRDLALAGGTHFTSPPQQPLTAEAVIAACSSPKSSKTFRQAIILIKWRNVRVDLRHALNESYHFDAESFTIGRRIITSGLSAVKANNKRGNFEAARQMLGEILHPLQDFYSHSNWVELGNKLPNSNLIRSDTSIGNIADVNRATCRNCDGEDGEDCRNNILEDIIQEKVLTSGYFGIVPFFSTKPDGKCSHGGPVDQTSKIEPKGGINKDKKTASHGHLHFEAARLATAATSELLEDIHAAAGDTDFLQLMGISKGSNKALCFVIDTTESMRDDIEAVKTVTSNIIDSKVGTQDEPSLYILVPFGDPDFGPLIRTTDPNLFKTHINGLTLQGDNNDLPEMSLSGLRLALTGSPPTSEIFLFTDANAKDSYLKSTVTALIERTKTVVNFMLTGVFGLRRRRRSDNGVQMAHMSRTGAQIYRDLAQASGGHAIEVIKSELPEATSIITESSASSLVTILQAARTPGKPDNFTFSVDESVTNLIIYITGRSMSFTLINPSGVSQSSADTTGPLGSIQTVGNFITMRLNKQEGSWEMRMVSTKPYTLKVIGQSDIDFLFDFVELAQGPFRGYDVLESRPRAGVNGSLVVSVTGSDSAAVTAVSLVETSGSGEVSGSVTLQEDGDYLVQVDRVPSTEFVVRVRGRLGGSSREYRASADDFQRQSATNLKASSLTVTADSDGILEPGTPFVVPFTVAANGTGGNVTIRATNDRGFDSTSPNSLLLPNGGSANGTVTLMAPLNTPSGSDVTLTIEAEAPGNTDTNYAVLLFSIVNTVTDFTRPVCQLASLQSECSESNCSSSTWRLSASVSDGPEGTGVERVSLKQGNGTLNTSVALSGAGDQNVTLVSYSASCCSPDVELRVVDEVGNVGSCFYTAREAPATTSSLPDPVTPAALAEATRASQPSYLCLNVAITLTLILAPLLGPC